MAEGLTLPRCPFVAGLTDSYSQHFTRVYAELSPNPLCLRNRHLRGLNHRIIQHRLAIKEGLRQGSPRTVQSLPSTGCADKATEIGPTFNGGVFQTPKDVGFNHLWAVFSEGLERCVKRGCC